MRLPARAGTAQVFWPHRPLPPQPAAGSAGWAATLAVTLGVAAPCRVVAAGQMPGMAMGTATRLGSFGFFIGVWAALVTAMILPGAAPAVLGRVRAGGGAWAGFLFAGWYLVVWVLAGVLVYAGDRPHGTVVAGAVTVAAGACTRRC